MSLATRQAMCMVAVTSGCMATYTTHFTDDEHVALADSIHKMADDVMVRYPSSGDPKKNLKWMEDKTGQWFNVILNLNPAWVKIVLTQMPLLALEDLLQKLRNPQAVLLVKPLTEALRGLSDLVDPEGDQFDAYKEAENILYRLYQILEFSP